MCKCVCDIVCICMYVCVCLCLCLSVRACVCMYVSVCRYQEKVTLAIKYLFVDNITPVHSFRRQENSRISFVFFLLFQNTFKIDVVVSHLVKKVFKSEQKNQKRSCPLSFLTILFFFDLFCSFCRIWLTTCPQTRNKQDHASGKIARCPLSFLLLDPPPPPSCVDNILLASRN